MSGFAAYAPSSCLDQSISCARCGYDLRTLPVDGRCPECASPISASLNPNLLSFTDPSWTTIIAFSFSVMIWGAVLELSQQLLTIWVQQNSDAMWSALAFTITITLGRQIFWIGLYLLAYPNPQPERARSLRVFRFCIRIIAVLGLLMTMFLGLSYSWIRFSWDLLANMLAVFYLLHLARRAGARTLIRPAKIAVLIVFLGRAISVFAVFAVDDEKLEKFVSPLYWMTFVALLYQVYLFYLFRRTLLKSAASARQYWHFCSPIRSPSPS